MFLVFCFSVMKKTQNGEAGKWLLKKLKKAKNQKEFKDSYLLSLFLTSSPLPSVFSSSPSMLSFPILYHAYMRVALNEHTVRWHSPTSKEKGPQNEICLADPLILVFSINNYRE